MGLTFTFSGSRSRWMRPAAYIYGPARRNNCMTRENVVRKIKFTHVHVLERQQRLPHNVAAPAAQ